MIHADLTRSNLERDKQLLLTQLAEARALLREALEEMVRMEWHEACPQCVGGFAERAHSLPCRIRQAVAR